LIIEDLASEDVKEIEIDKLLGSRFRLRPVDQNVVRELARSIAHVGLLQPILVRQVSDDHFEVVFGLHRLEACRQLGMTKVKALVRPLSSDDAFLACVAENLQRNAVMDAFEEARGYRALIANGWTLTEISRKIGKSDSYVSDRLNLIRRLHPRIAARIEHNHRKGNVGAITASHAQRLARVKDSARQLELATLIEQARLSVRGLESVLKKRSARGRFFPKVRRSSTISIPVQLTERLNIVEGDILEARIRHRTLTLTKLCGTNRASLYVNASEDASRPQ